MSLNKYPPEIRIVEPPEKVTIVAFPRVGGRIITTLGLQRDGDSRE